MVMLKRRYRLRWKDVNFLVRRRQYFSYGFFWFFYFEQYPNLKFNQISVNIPVKYNKRAVERVRLKRIVNTYLSNNWYDKKVINGKFYKIFVFINKNSISELKSQMEKFDKEHVNHYISSEFEKSFFKFLNKIWN
jgi:RNase P protein component